MLFELWALWLGLVAVCGMTRGSWFSFVALCFALGAGDLWRSEGHKAHGAALRQGIRQTLSVWRDTPKRKEFEMKISILNTIAVSAVFAAVTSYTITPATAAPAASEDIVAVASGNSDFSTLVAALTAAELVEALQGAGPFTVFAPNNAAFAKLPAGTVDDLLKPENKAKLTAILKNHVVSGKVMAADVKAGPVPTLGGGDVVIAVEGGGVKYGDAMVIGTDVLASNGVIHVIDTVVVPD